MLDAGSMQLLGCSGLDWRGILRGWRPSKAKHGRTDFVVCTRALGGKYVAAMVWSCRLRFFSCAYVVHLSTVPGYQCWVMNVLRWRLWAPIAGLSYFAYPLQYIGMFMTVLRLYPQDEDSVALTTVDFLSPRRCVRSRVLSCVCLICPRRKAVYESSTSLTLFIRCG